MHHTQLETAGRPFSKARAANSTDAAFPAKIPTVTEPTGGGVINLVNGQLTPNGLVIVPYAVGANDDTFSLRIWGWRALSGDPAALWLPVLLAELACTLGTTVGIAGQPILNTERFADLITLTSGDAGVSIDVVSPGGDLVAHAMADTKGFQKVEVTFQLGGTTTSMNALVALL